MRISIRARLLATIAAGLCGVGGANAATFNLDYQSTTVWSGSALNAHFIVTTAGDASATNPAELITGFSGNVNGDVVTGLLPQFIYGNSNAFTTSGQPLYGGGIAFSTATNNWYLRNLDVYRLTSAGGVYYDTMGNVSFSPAAAVPEPATYAMLIAGLGILSVGGRRNKSVAKTTKITA